MPSALRHVFDLAARIAWLTFAALLFIASAALIPFLLAAFMCGRLSRKPTL